MAFALVLVLSLTLASTENCTEEMKGDEVCDRICMTPASAYDSTGASDCTSTCASHCSLQQLGDSHCDAACNTWDCRWDAGDCGDCAVNCPLSALGNGVCDTPCNLQQCSYDAGDCVTPSAPFAVFVAGDGSQDGDGGSESPFNSVTKGVESLWLPHNIVYLQAGGHVLSPFTTSVLLPSKSLRTTVITTLLCSLSAHPHCSQLPVTLALSPQFLSFTVSHAVTFDSIVFRGGFSLKTGCGMETCRYCPYQIFDTSINAYINDRGEVIDRGEYAEQRLCDEYKDKRFIQVTRDGTLTISNTQFLDFRHQLDALISNECGIIALNNVSFDNCIPRFAGLSGGLIRQLCPDDKAPYYCGSITYIGGKVTRMNNGYEYRDDIVTSGLMDVDGVSWLKVSGVWFEWNFMPIGAIATTQQSTLLMLRRFRQAEISNCTFRFNVASLSVGLTVIHSLKIPVVLDENNVAVDFMLRHLVLEDLAFVNNTARVGTVLYVEFQTNHLNVLISNCSFLNNFSTAGPLLAIRNDQLLHRYANGEFVPTLVSGQLIDVWIPPRYVNVTQVRFIDNYAHGLGTFEEIGNLHFSDVECAGNGESLSEIDSHRYIISQYQVDQSLYVSEHSGSYPSAYQCTLGFEFRDVLKLNAKAVTFRGNYCPHGSPGIAVYDSPAITAFHSLTFDSNEGAQLLSFHTATSIPLSNLTFVNNTNHNTSLAVCIRIDPTAPVDVLISQAEFVGNSGDAMAVAMIVHTKTVEIDGILVQGNSVDFSYPGIVYSPYPYAPSTLIIRNSNFRQNTADSEGVLAVMDFYGVLSDNFAAIVTLIVENCEFSDNHSEYQGASITLGDFTQFSSRSLITSTRFLRNFSETGAGINLRFQTGTVTIRDCVFMGNDAPEGGAGIYAHQYASTAQHFTYITISECLFTENQGAALSIVGYLAVSEVRSQRNHFVGNYKSPLSMVTGLLQDRNSVFGNNTAQFGAAVVMTQSSVLEVVGSRFEGNYAAANGGCVHSSYFSTALFTDVWFVNNSADGDGGVLFTDFSGETVFSNCSLTGNFANYSASTIYSFASTVRFRNSSLWENVSRGYALMVLTRANLELSKSLVTANSAAKRTSGLLLASTDIAIADSLFSNQQGLNGAFIQGVNNNNVRISHSQFLNGSAAIDGGAIYAGLETVITIDFSVFEHCVAESQGGAIFLAKSAISCLSSSFLDNNATTGGVIEISDGTLVVVNCTIQKYKGGALKVHSSALVNVSDSLFIESIGSVYRGGAIYLTDCEEVNILRSVFEGNSADSGGALYFYSTLRKTVNDQYYVLGNVLESNWAPTGGALESDGVDLLLSHNSFLNNSAVFQHDSTTDTNGQGGAAVLRCDTPSACNLTVTSNNFTHNTASLAGGAVHWRETVPLFEDNYYEGNEAVYGQDTASFPIQLGPIGLSGGRTEYLGMNGSVPVALSVKGVASGQLYTEVLRFALFDHISQIERTDNSSYIELQSLDSSIISGKVKESSSQGVFTLTDFSITAPPDSIHYLRLSTNGVNTKLKAICNDSADYYDSIYIRVEFRNCTIGEMISDNACVVCQPETYSIDPAIPCKTCLSSAICYGGASVVPKKGFWRPRNDTDRFFECLNPDACIGSPEPPGESLTGLCADGYTGNLCHSCQSGHSRTGRNNCSRCPGHVANISVTTLIVLVALSAVVLIVALAIRGATRPRSLMAIYFKIFLNYLQMVVIAASLNLNWPSFAKTFLSSQELAGSMADQLFSFECLLNDAAVSSSIGLFTSKLLLIGLLPIFLIAMSLMAWGSLLLIKSVEKVMQRLVATFVVILFIVHPSITKAMFSVYACMEILPGEYWLIADLSEKCWTSGHMKTIFLISIPSIGVWVLGLPTVVLALLIKGRLRLADFSHRLMYSFLYKGYEQKWFYWEFVILYRKVGIVGASVFLSQVSVSVESLTILAILLSAIFFQLRYQPFNDSTLNTLEVKSILVSAVTIYSGLYYNTAQIGYIVNVCLFVVIITCNAYFLINWLRYTSPVILATLRERWKQLTKQRKPYRVQHYNSSAVELKDVDKSDSSNTSQNLASSSPFDPATHPVEPTESMAPPCNTPERLAREFSEAEDPACGQHFSLR